MRDYLHCTSSGYCDYCSHYLQGHVYSARCMKTSHRHVHEPLMSQLATPLNGTCPALGHHFPCHLPQLGLLKGLKKPHPVAKYRKSGTGERRPALSRGGDFKFKTNTSGWPHSSQVLNFIFCVVRPVQRGSNSVFLMLSLPGSFTGMQRWLRYKLLSPREITPHQSPTLRQ